MSVVKEKLLDEVKKINGELNSHNTNYNVSIYRIVNIIQKMNEVFKEDMVDINSMILDNNIYHEIRKEVEKMVEYNTTLNEFINSDKLVYDSFKILYTSCYNGSFPLPSNEIVKESQKNLINRLFEERYLLTKPHNDHFNPTVTEDQFLDLKQKVNKINLYYNNSIINVSQNNPLNVINNMFESLKNNISYNIKTQIR